MGEAEVTIGADGAFAAALVTIGDNDVSPHEANMSSPEGWFWLYGKTAAGWRRISLLGGFET